MFRIAIGQINHESNPMAHSMTTLEDFKRCAWFEGNDIFSAYAGVNDYITGMIDQGRIHNVQLIPTLSTSAPPSGLITNDCYQTIRTTLLNQLRRQSPFDGICLALHGAGQSEGNMDIEGDILKSLRHEFGTDMPIFISLDLHSHITSDIIAHCTGMVGVKHYPHIDYHQTGARAMELLFQTLNHSIQPVMSVLRIPMLVTPASAATFESPAKDIRELMESLSQNVGILDCTFYHGFPYGDTPETSAYVSVISNGSVEQAKATATRIKDTVWEHRDRFSAAFPSPREGITLARQATSWPVIINETSDNPGSGTPGDGTFLLAALLEANIPKTCFGFIYDPDVAAQAHTAGIGACLNIQLGGKTDQHHGSPLDLSNARVAALSEGTFTIISPMMTGMKIHLGPTARLVVGNVDIIVAGTRVQTFDDQLFTLVGIDIREYRIIALKSIQHFKAYFNQVAGTIITVDPPGLSTSQLGRLHFKHLTHPIYPLEKW